MGRLQSYRWIMLGVMLLPALVWATEPIKLRIDTSAANGWTGQPQTARITFLDTNDVPVATPRDWSVKLTLKLPTGTTQTQTLKVPAGSMSQLFTFTPDQAGVWEVSVSHRELLADTTVLMTQPKLSPPTPPNPSGRTREGGGIDLSEILRGQPSIPPQLELRATPRRKLLADGKDSASIYALLVAPVTGAPEDVTLSLLNDDGTLAPDVVVIPKGKFSGTARLTAQRSGKVTVEYVGATPAAQLLGTPRVEVDFGPPITKLGLSTSPPQMSLLEATELVVRLLDESGKPLATDEPRQVFLTIDKGNGELEPNTLNFPPGGAEQRARLRPTRVGAVEIAAASTGLLTVRGTVQVHWPLIAIVLSALGGLVGGALAYLQERRKTWQRLATGLVTGFILYWAIVFIGLEQLPAAIALNPLSAFALSVIGGWLGIKVFELLLKRLGVST